MALLATSPNRRITPQFSGRATTCEATPYHGPLNCVLEATRAMRLLFTQKDRYSRRSHAARLDPSLP